jgi:hypothetical protein
MNIAVRLLVGWVSAFCSGSLALLLATELERMAGLLGRVFSTPMLLYDLKMSVLWGCVVACVSAPFLAAAKPPRFVCYIVLAVLHLAAVAAVLWFILPQSGGRMQPGFMMTTAPLILLALPTGWLMLRGNDFARESYPWNAQRETGSH